MNRAEAIAPRKRSLRPGTSTYVMSLIIIVLGFYLMGPVVLLLIQSFNVARDMLVGPAQWGLTNWVVAWQTPGLFQSLWHSVMIWGLGALVSWPISITIAWTLARTRIPFSYGLEYLFWVAFMLPTLSSTIGWMMLLDPDVGILNGVIERLPFVDRGPFNIFTIPGLVWAGLMANGIAYKVMLLTPAFRNMDASLEEASRMAGGSNLKTMLRITLPVMLPPIALIFALQLIRMFQGFETEQLIGTRFGFFVYSTKVYSLMNQPVPLYQQAVVLASVTLVLIAAIIPLQRWIVQRRRYTTIASHFRPGLIELGKWRWVAVGLILAIVFLMTVAPVIILVLGSFMTRAGFFNAVPVFTMNHWTAVLTDRTFLRAFQTTIILASTAAIVSPLLFSILAYLIVRTRWRGRAVLDSMIWLSAAIPGILASLGLLLFFLGTPGLMFLYGSIWALILVVVISGNTTGVNIFKGVFVQVGQEMEEASRIAGGGWFTTYLRVWIPIIMPTMVLIGVLNFVSAAGATANIILLSSRDTITLSILALNFAGGAVGRMEQAGIISLIIMVLTLGIALVARNFGLRIGVRQDVRSRDPVATPAAAAPGVPSGLSQRP